jgi:hypothetical protein
VHDGLRIHKSNDENYGENMLDELFFKEKGFGIRMLAKKLMKKSITLYKLLLF